MSTASSGAGSTRVGQLLAAAWLAPAALDWVGALFAGMYGWLLFRGPLESDFQKRREGAR